MTSKRQARADVRREGRFLMMAAFAALAAVLVIGLLIGLYRMAQPWIEASWGLVPVELRLTARLALAAAAVTVAILTVTRTSRNYSTRRQARLRAREEPVVLEFIAGSVHKVANATGEVFDGAAKRFLAFRRRRYLVPPQNEARRRRDWGAPVVLVEPTMAGDTRIVPVLALSSSERPKHVRNLRTLTNGIGQLALLRVVIGIGNGFTSVARAHALRDHLAALPAKSRMNVIVLDRLGGKADPAGPVPPQSPDEVPQTEGAPAEPDSMAESDAADALRGVFG